MFEAPIMAAFQMTSADETATGPIAGIALALPFSLAIWAVIVGTARFCF